MPGLFSETLQKMIPLICKCCITGSSLHTPCCLRAHCANLALPSGYPTGLNSPRIFGGEPSNIFFFILKGKLFKGSCCLAMPLLYGRTGTFSKYINNANGETGPGVKKKKMKKSFHHREASW